MQLTVGLLTGREFVVTVNPASSIWDLKRKIEDEELIPSDAQVLIFRDKPLPNASSIGDVGIRDGSRLQLVVEMAGGPGPPIKLRKMEKAKNDSVVFLLCKQDEGLYMVELHVADEVRSSKSRQVLKLANGKSIQVLSAESAAVLAGLTAGGDGISEYCSRSSSRPASSDSTVSTSSFLSLLATSSTLSSVSPRTPNRAIDALACFNADRTCYGADKASRPATAISIMRLPNGARPMIAAVDSRPATAAKGDVFRTVKKPATPSVKRGQQSKVETPSTSRIGGKTTGKSSKSVRFSTSSEDSVSASGSDEENFEEHRLSVLGLIRADAIPIELRPMKSAESESKANYDKPNSEPGQSRARKSSTPRSSRSTLATPQAVRKDVKTYCEQCRKKLLSTTAFKCRCSRMFCSIHRYSDRHECSFNYREAGRIVLARENPKITSKKV
ncbi:switch-activating protein Sap1 [Irineochytrium annulatum]|nr:switch-activating protein Sap1 [Irineochytrium annulatum]